MDQQAYVARVAAEGTTCPNCHGFNVEYKGLDFADSLTIYQEAVCSDCGADWADWYSLGGYDDLNVPEVATDV